MSRPALPSLRPDRIADTTRAAVRDVRRRAVVTPSYIRRFGRRRALQVGTDAIEAGDPDAAEQIADTVLEITPTSRRARLLKARVHAARGEHDALGSVLIKEAVRGKTASMRQLMQEWADARRNPINLADPELADSIRLLNLSGFRDQLAGKSIVLVGDRVPEGAGLGHRVDGYDLVLRFNNYPRTPSDSGARTDIHVAFHSNDGRFEDPVDVRILLSPRPAPWRASMKQRLVPGKQHWVGDQSLRWPAAGLGLITADDPFRFPTAAFSMVRLLLQLGGCRSIDLVGFGPPAGGWSSAGRHDHEAEWAWIRAHARPAADDKIISLDTDAAAQTTVRGRDLVSGVAESAAEPIPAPGADSIAAAEALVADGDYAGALDTLQRLADRSPGPLADPAGADRFLFLLARTRRALSHYDEARDILRMSQHDEVTAGRASTQQAEIAWIQHDHAAADTLARYAVRANPANRGASDIRHRAQQTIAAESADPPDGGLAHAGFYVKPDGNYGDAVLPPTVRAAIENVTGDQQWLPIHVHQQFDEERLRQVNRQRALIIGGGGLFLPDTSPNGNSGWQWNVPTPMLDRITVPISVYAVGYNLFGGQSFHGSLFHTGLLALAERARMLGLRNHGSIDRVADQLPARLHDRLHYVPCPTTVLQQLLPDPPPARTGTGTVLINAAFDRFDRRFGGGYAAFLRQLEGLVQQLRALGSEVRLVAHLPADERLGDDLRDGFGLRLPVDALYAKPIEDGYARYRDAGVVIGMRGHATMIPFGLGTPVLSIVSHPKMRYFLDDIQRPDWGIDVDHPDLGAVLADRAADILTAEDRYRADIVDLQRDLKSHLDNATRIATG